ncbi:MAG: hypothetical protein IK115_05045 [Lachnospiraceae bacterium]|nr:hypothetical protein [Lachnospiraceae bacterium]
MGKKDRGAVSVYLALMMAVMIPLILTMMEAARVGTIKLRMECAADLSMDSVLAEYNRALFDRYDLLFIDTSYDGGYGSEDALCERLEYYLDRNLKPVKAIPLPGVKDPCDLKLDSLELTRVSRATDEGGAVFRYMALSYMLERYGIGYVAGAMDLMESSASAQLSGTDVSAELFAAQGQVDAFEAPAPPEEEEAGEDWEEPPEKDRPADAVEASASAGLLLGQVIRGEISGAVADLPALASQRSLIVGDGMPEDWEDRNSLEEQLLFTEFIMEKCANYREPKDGCQLKYETEYVIAGKDNDRDNLESVAFKLFLLRGTSNTVYFFSDGAKQAEAEAMAAGLAFVCCVPEAQPLFKALIEAAWIYAETINDLKILFDGGKVPLVKSEADWKLSLSSALGMAATGGEGGNGLTYQDHLRIFLYTTSLEKRTARCMDVVEMDVRLAGYPDFRLDNCVAGATVQLIVSSGYGYSFLMERRFRYA